MRYELYFGDECLAAPSALFNTELLRLSEGAKAVRTMDKDKLGDSEDPHDNIYLSETSRKYTRVRKCDNFRSFCVVKNLAHSIGRRWP